MKRDSLFTFLGKMMIFIIAIYFTSCQKEVSQDVTLETNAETKLATDEVNAWLDDKKSTASQEKILVIESVKSNLDLKNLYIEKLNETEKLIIVPVKSGFKSAVNSSKQVFTNLLLIENAQGIIRKGNIVQYIAPNNATVKKLPVNTFSNFYNADHLVCDGSFTFINMSDKILYEMEYKNGKLSAYSEKQNKKDINNTNNNLTAPSNCTDWYWVTTYYNADGTTTVTAEYLYTTCNNYDESIEPEGGGGAGGGGEIEYIQPPKQIDWAVESGAYSGNLFWELSSTETMNGVKNASEPGGGHFTGIAHQGEILFQYGGFVWTKSGITVTFSPSTASSTVSGSISRNGNSVSLILGRQGNFAFSSIFP